MGLLARRMADGDDLYRAVVQWDTGTTEYHGPFARIGSARARRTQRVNELNYSKKRVVGWVEVANVSWEKVPE